MLLVSSFLVAPLSFGIRSLQNAGEILATKAIVALDISSMRYRDSMNTTQFPDSTGVLRALDAARVYRLLSVRLMIFFGGSLARNWFSEGAFLRKTFI